MEDALIPGAVLWAKPDPVVIGQEQKGRRPALVISSIEHLDIVKSLVIVLPCTTKHREGWENHVRLDAPGLPEATWAMTEQPRSISRERLMTGSSAGVVSQRCLEEAMGWVQRWIAFQ